MLKSSRRNFLRSVGIASLFPFLESFASTVKTKPSKKLIFFYIPNGIVRRGFFPGESKEELPDFKGDFSADELKKNRIINKPGTYNLDFTPTMKPLKGSLSRDITLVTGMDRTFMNGQDVHAQGSMAYLTSVSPGQAEEKGWHHPNGRTLDHIIADSIGNNSAFPTLEISCNGFKKGKEPPHFDNISWYGNNQVATSIKDPQKLYNRLFQSMGLGKHVSEISGLILSDVKTLSRRVSKNDQAQLNNFMHMVRSIEVRINKLRKIVADAGIDRPDTSADEVIPRGQYIKVMADLMITSLQLGLTNICTFMVGPERWQAPMMYEGVFSQPVIHHSMTHNQKGDGWKELMKIDLFHMEQYAYILKKMKSQKEIDGSSMLDNSIVTYGAAMGDGATHQYFDLPFIIAGKAQGQIKQGRFIKCKSGTLNSNMWLSIAQLMGLNIESYADSSSAINLG